MTGEVRIAVDGEVQLHNIEFLSPGKSMKLELSVGTTEHHEVTFIKSRPLFLAPYRNEFLEVAPRHSRRSLCTIVSADGETG